MRTRDADNPNDLDQDQRVLRSAWQEIIEAAQRHYEPGKFTTFVGYEYTASGGQSQNLHRNVIFRDENVPKVPYSRFDSVNPEDLWSWMDKHRAQGIESLAIPHNSNGSDGWMFASNQWSGEAIDADWAEQRMRNEPLVENTQVKGTSDMHPLLSPNDEWANFEIMPLRIASVLSSQAPGSYVRDAYLNGLLLEQQIGVNPYQFGVIGASDTHNAAGSFEEDNFGVKRVYLTSIRKIEAVCHEMTLRRIIRNTRTTLHDIGALQGLLGYGPNPILARQFLMLCDARKRFLPAGRT